MSDEQLWRPSVRQGGENDKPESELSAGAELFDTNKWRRDKNDPTDEQLASGNFPMWRPKVKFDCDYGCPGIVIAGDEDARHTWNCPYWWNEGKAETPF